MVQFWRLLLHRWQAAGSQDKVPSFGSQSIYPVSDVFRSHSTGLVNVLVHCRYPSAAGLTTHTARTIETWSGWTIVALPFFLIAWALGDDSGCDRFSAPPTVGLNFVTFELVGDRAPSIQSSQGCLLLTYDNRCLISLLKITFAPVGRLYRIVFREM